jgi:hypothetical protein
LSATYCAATVLASLKVTWHVVLLAEHVLPSLSQALNLYPLLAAERVRVTTVFSSKSVHPATTGLHD